MQKTTIVSQQQKIYQKQPVNKNEKNKTKKFNNQEHHQNPYIPPKIQPNKKFQQTQNKKIQIDQISTKTQEKQTKTHSQSEIHQKEKFQQNQNLQKQQENYSQEEFNHLKIQSDSNNFLNLPENFKHLSLPQRYSILSKKHGNNKKILQKRFDVIYKHYRKQMYIPNESFQINNDLLMDLKIFLKYFKDFDISTKFKTNQAIKQFKKIALNGLWLNNKNFIQIHYKLIELLDVNLLLQNFDSSDPEKVKSMKKQTLKSIKDLQQNLIKIKSLSDIISQTKINEVIKRANHQKIVKKIVQSHSGLSQQDVLLKLKERVQEKANKKNLNLKQKVNIPSSNKIKITGENAKTSRAPQSLHELSLYKQIELPQFRSRQMRNSSVYSSLQILNYQKQKQKLRELLRQKDNQMCLQQFFRKQKKVSGLVRSYSLSLIKNKTKDSLSASSSISNNRLPKINTFQRNFSLPRMKFT